MTDREEELKDLSQYHHYTENQKINYWSKYYKRDYRAVDPVIKNNWVQLSKDIDAYLHSQGKEKEYYWLYMDNLGRRFCDPVRYFDEIDKEKMITDYAKKLIPHVKIYMFY